MSPEEAAYIRSIGLSGGWDTSLYHMQEIAGLYGWFGSLARPQIGHPVGKVDIADASRGYGRERRFYDQEIGGIGGNISDILLYWGRSFHLMEVVTFGPLRVREGLPCGVENPVSATFRAYGGVFGPESRVYWHAFRGSSGVHGPEAPDQIGFTVLQKLFYRSSDRCLHSSQSRDRADISSSGRLKAFMRSPIKLLEQHGARDWQACTEAKICWPARRAGSEVHGRDNMG